MPTRFRVPASFAVVLPLSVLCLLSAACHVDGSVKAGTNVNEPVDDRSNEQGSTPAAAAAPVTAAPAPVAAAPATPPADACPLSCYETRGSEKANLAPEEIAQLRTALEPVMGRMRTCTSADDWRRHGSPVLNLRIGPDGTLSELGVDPHHGREAACFDNAGQGGANTSLSLPGRKVVRCSERCVREASAPGQRGRGRRPR